MSTPVWLVVLTLGQSASPDVAALAQLEAVWNDAHRRGDAAALERLFADDVVVVVPGMRPMTKHDSLKVLAAGRMKFERYDSSDLAVRVYGDTAVVTGRLWRTRVMASGTKADDAWRFTKVYLRRAGSWRVISFHASSVASNDGPAAVGFAGHGPTATFASSADGYGGLESDPYDCADCEVNLCAVCCRHDPPVLGNDRHREVVVEGGENPALQRRPCRAVTVIRRICRVE